jgi:hypothetical protein
MLYWASGSDAFKLLETRQLRAARNPGQDLSDSAMQVESESEIENFGK